MGKIWASIKSKARAAWARIKGVVYGVLIALGLVTGYSLAAVVNVSWTNPTSNTDGSPFDPATEQAESRIYCGVDPVSFVPEKPADASGSARASSHTPTQVTLGAATGAGINLTVGNHQCFATVLSVYGYESDPSNVATFVVTPSVAPAAPTSFGETP